MLYKKYHRSYVKQFKVGVGFKLEKDSNYIRTIATDPFIRSTLVTRKPFVAVNYITVGRITDKHTSCIIVYSDGRIDKYRHVIQEIS